VKKRILIVDDDATLRRYFRMALQLAGFEIQEASDALVALNLIQQDPPDLVVLDLHLPTISGRAVHEDLTATRDIPIVVVTGSTEVHDFPAYSASRSRPINSLRQ
jgi:two-component system OmpR family response regulator